MNLYALLILIFIPLIAVFLLFSILIKGQKIRYSLWACLLGFAAVFPAAFVQFFVLSLPVFNTNTVISLLVTAVIFNGLIEESFKMVFMAFLPWRRVSLNVFFACAILSGMTLGCFESVIYFINRIQNSLNTSDTAEIYHLIFSRMFTSVIIHTFCAGLSGLYLWTFKHKKIHIAPFIYAVILHGIYNFFAGFRSNFYWFSVVAILLAAVECRIWFKAVQADTNSPDNKIDDKTEKV